MEKAATYTVMTPPHPCKRQWVAWGAVGVSVIALVVACVTAAVVNEQAAHVNHLEGRIMEMESHLEYILRLMIAADHDYQYEDDPMDSQSEGITVRKVVRRRRQVNSVENELLDTSNVPIYERAYGVNLKTQTAPKGLRLYDSLLDNDEEDPNETTQEVTESPIKHHHRVSSMWVPKRRRSRLPSSSGPPTLSSRTVVRQVDSTDGDGNELDENLFPSPPASLRRSRLTQRRSRTKSLQGSRRGTKRQQKQRARSNKATDSVVFRPSLVKATSPQDGFSSPNSVVPPILDNLQAPKVVEQDVGKRTQAALARPPTRSFYGKHKRGKLRNKQHRRRRRARPIITLAHFGASSRNTTTPYGLQAIGEHLDWTPATWMDKLGLNSKYNLERGTVTVKEPGLYYLYAQVLYESGRSGAGFQILVDDIPVLECQLPALRPAPTCNTGGLSYLPRNAKVRVRDLNNNLTTMRQERNTFFGMVKLMDAR